MVTAFVESPIVKGNIVFATEAFDDDGLPHTLEHLVFMGSDSYPYKGVLDLIANKCFSQGTNAYTDTDHTAYTVSTAGKDGFLSLLPIYLDHLLFPTLTDYAYLTEVHHINAEAEDAGVVYCEMQARENTGESICHREMLNALYPGHCGYRSETGGMLENFRQSTSNEKVRKYHQDFYYSKNMCIIVTGPIVPHEIFDAIKIIEDKIVSRGLHDRQFVRPWSTTVEPLANSSKTVIRYQSDSHDDGLVYLGYRGPSVCENYLEFVAISIILEYLNNTAVSPIQLEFVESEDPICSSISHSLIENSVSCFNFEFESVDKKHLDYSILDKLNDVLRSVVEQKKIFDMPRLQTIISRRIVQILATAETSPHSIIAGPVIGHFLYGHGSISERTREIQQLEALAKHDEFYWLSLIKNYMLGDTARYSLVIGVPSPEKMTENSEQEKNRLAKQREALKNQLVELKDKLDMAKLKNDEPPPADVLAGFPSPSTDNIIYHQIERTHVDWDEPIRLQYDSIKTNFITQILLMNTSKCLTKEERLYLPLLSEIIFECPIIRAGKEIPYETVIESLYSDTVSYSSSVGISGPSVFSAGFLSMLFVICMQVEVSKHQNAIDWVSDILYNSVFSPERIKTIATRMLSDISQLKRSGSKMNNSVMGTLLYRDESNQWAANFLRQHTFLKQLLQDIKKNPSEVQAKLTHIRDCLARPGNILIHLSLDKNKVDIDEVKESYRRLIPQSVTSKSGPVSQINLDDITPCHQLVRQNPPVRQAAIGLGSSDSKYFSQIVPSIHDLNHPDLAPLYVLTQYLTQLEGPLWREVRGLGLSYHIDISISPSEGVLQFLLYKSTQVVEAYEKCFAIVLEHTREDSKFSEHLMASAKSSLVFDFIRREKSPADRSLQSLICYLRKLPIEFNKQLISKVEAVTSEDLLRVGPKYLRPLFELDNKLSVLSCHSNEVESLKEKLKEIGCGDLEVLSVDKTSFLTAL